MPDLLLFLGGVLVVTIACAEVPLFLYRKFLGLNCIYPFIAAVVRATAYSPCILGAGHGALPFLLGPALWALTQDSSAIIIWFFGIPELIVGAGCFAVSTSFRQEMMARGGQPTIRANGRRRPWLILNVRQRR